jgi:hypothetical protein
MARLVIPIVQPFTDRLLQRLESGSLRNDGETRLPTLRRENTSITTATYAKPRHVATYVKPGPQI